MQSRSRRRSSLFTCLKLFLVCNLISFDSILGLTAATNQSILQKSKTATTTTTMMMSMSTSSTNAVVNGSPPAVKIAIIGGGAAGLAAAKAFQKYKHIDITVLEKNNRIGGVWNYQSGSGSAHHPMYQNLRTNLPKEIMAYREFPWPVEASSPAATDASFVTHQQVQSYMEEYAKHYKLEQYIHTCCTVQQLTVLADTESAFSGPVEKWPKVELKWSDETNKNDDNDNDEKSCNPEITDVFDGILICNGHYSKPAIPNEDTLPGIETNFKGKVMHSIAYDRPSDFAGQTVLCIGARASGADIAREIATHSTHVYLSDSTYQDTQTTTEYNVTWVPRTKAILSDGSIQFDYDCPETPQVDTIIFCNGYDYNFPFITDQSNLELDTRQRRVKPLYQQLWHAHYPNIAFVGLPHSVVPFPCFELQAQATAHQWMIQQSTKNMNDDKNQQQKYCIPNRSQREEEALKDAESGGPEPNGRVPQDTHFLGPHQWDYCRTMAKFADVFTEEVDQFIETQKVIYDDAGKQRKGMFPAAPDEYRSLCYKRNDAAKSFTRWTLGDKAVAPSRTDAVVVKQ